MERAPATDDPPAAATTRRRRLAALALGVLLAMAVSEGALRVYHGVKGTYELDDQALAARRASLWQRSDDPELAYVHRPGYRGGAHAQTEAHGLLAPTDVPLDKPAGVRRVAVVGDSVGAGLNVPHDRRFATVLERVLRDVGEAVEVLNFCVNGYSTRQEARLLETRVAAFDVDAVVVQYCMNDPVVTYTPMAWFVDPEPPTVYVWEAVRSGLRAARGESPHLPYVPKGTFESAGFWEQHYDPTSESWESVRDGFARMAAWGKRHDVPVLLAIVPLFAPHDPAGRSSRAFREQAAAEARAAGLLCVDLQSAIARRDVAALQMAPGDPYHPSAAGHEVLGRALVPPVLDLLVDAR